jgi:hypothetical protein
MGSIKNNMGVTYYDLHFFMLMDKKEGFIEER